MFHADEVAGARKRRKGRERGPAARRATHATARVPAAALGIHTATHWVARVGPPTASHAFQRHGGAASRGEACHIRSRSMHSTTALSPVERECCWTVLKGGPRAQDAAARICAVLCCVVHSLRALARPGSMGAA